MTNDDRRARHELGSRCVASERWGSRAGAAEAVSKALNDAHDATTIGTGRNLGPGMSVRSTGDGSAIVWRCPLMIEKFAAKGELGGAMAVGHEAEMADAMEAVGQRMKQEAADELVGLELHDLCRAVLAVVLPGEGDMIVVEGDEPAVGDRDAMGVAAEIGQDLCGSAEGPLGVNNPVDASHGVEVSREGAELGQRSEIAEEAQGAGVEGGRQTFEKKSSERAGTSGLTARKKFGRLAIQRAPSGERPPPGTTQ